MGPALMGQDGQLADAEAAERVRDFYYLQAARRLPDVRRGDARGAGGVSCTHALYDAELAGRLYFAMRGIAYAAAPARLVLSSREEAGGQPMDSRLTGRAPRG